MVCLESHGFQHGLFDLPQNILQYLRQDDQGFLNIDERPVTLNANKAGLAASSGGSTEPIQCFQSRWHNHPLAIYYLLKTISGRQCHLHPSTLKARTV